MSKIIKKLVDSLRPDPAKDYWHWDAELPGFGVRVWPSGRKVYVAQYRAQGRTRRVSLGTHGAVTPEQARKEALKVLAGVAKGDDPAEARDQGRKASTVRELAERYLSQHAEAKKKPASIIRDRRLIERFILPAMGSMKIDAVSRADVARLHHKIGQATPIQANRILAVLSKMMTLGVRWGLRSDAQGNPCRYVERFKENKRERYLSAEELARLGAVLAQAEAEGTGFPPAIAAIRLLLLTGARVGEILGLRWEWVDFERGCAFLPDSKTGKKTIPLGGAALELLQSLPRVAGNPHVLPGDQLGRHLADVNTTWYKVRKAAGLEGVRLHDLRHTAASMGAASGLSLPIIGGILGHRAPATTARYAHLANDPLRAGADIMAGKVAEALNRPAAPKVVALHREK
ncbi:MAG: tyrosine-type recombinase/integrase [Thermodesulfobacteriota bacterium]